MKEMRKEGWEVIGAGFKCLRYMCGTEVSDIVNQESTTLKAEDTNHNKQT